METRGQQSTNHRAKEEKSQSVDRSVIVMMVIITKVFLKRNISVETILSAYARAHTHTHTHTHTHIDNIIDKPI